MELGNPACPLHKKISPHVRNWPGGWLAAHEWLLNVFTPEADSGFRPGRDATTFRVVR